MNFKGGPLWLNHIITGLASGLLLPLLSFYLYYRIEFPYMGHWQFIRHLENGGILGHVLTMSVVLNLILFFFYINTSRDSSARGVLFSTFIYAGIIFYIKYS